MINIKIVTLIVVLLSPSLLYAKHNSGKDCLSCHSAFKLAGSVFSDVSANSPHTGMEVSLKGWEGNKILVSNTDTAGNFFSPEVSDGSYRIRVGNMTSRTWHTIPGQGSCNTCHISGGNRSQTRTKQLPEYHTALPLDNDCTHCHHFPATMSYAELMTPGVLNSESQPPQLPISLVSMKGVSYSFDPAEYSISTVRPDIFAPGYYSMFDVILAVAKKNDLPVEYYYDETRKTHFITKVNNEKGDYWYHFAFDAGDEQALELSYRRAYRWDEALWRPGVWIQLVGDEFLSEIKSEYLEEINRENKFGHIIPSVRISINPSNYDGNPNNSGRITVSRDYENVKVTAHNIRATGYPSPYSKPFQPGVVTSIDLLLSLQDQGEMDLVTSVFYSHFAQNYIDSYYVVALGFPGVGVAHSSGRQGFVYSTNNGSYGRLPNFADSKFHMTSDISVIHSPDFSYWRWIELGNPYYERNEPASVHDPQIMEDYKAIGRGFSFHVPTPNPFNSKVSIRINVFNPDHLNLSVYNVSGQKITTLHDTRLENIGIHELSWSPKGISTGVYLLVAKMGKATQVQSVSYLK